MKGILFAVISLLFAISYLQFPVAAQTHLPSPRAEGELKGLVLDPNGARIVGAKITVENKNYSFAIESNDEGAFRVKLPGGEYRLKIKRDGFKAYVKKRVRIEADKTETISVTLRPLPPTDVIKVK